MVPYGWRLVVAVEFWVLVTVTVLTTVIVVLSADGDGTLARPIVQTETGLLWEMENVVPMTSPLLP